LMIRPLIENVTGDGLLNSNLLTAYLNDKGAKETVDGGLELWAGVLKGESSNFKWQGKSDDMTAQEQDPLLRMSWAFKIFTGSLAVNDFDKARIKGKLLIKEYLTTLKQQAEGTIQNQFNSALWKTTPGDDEPNSIPSIVSATPTTGSIGGVNRAGEPALQNGVDTSSVADIGSEAGIAFLTKMKIKNAAGKMMSDLIMMTETQYANLAGYLVTNKRFMANDKMAQLGFDTIQLGNTVIGYENTNVLGGANTLSSGYVYGLCTKNGALKIKTLKDGDGVFADKFERVGQKMLQMLPYYWFGNIITNNPRVHWVATGVVNS